MSTENATSVTVTSYRASVSGGGTKHNQAGILLSVEGFDVRAPLDDRNELATVREALEHLLPPNAHIASLERVAEAVQA